MEHFVQASGRAQERRSGRYGASGGAGASCTAGTSNDEGSTGLSMILTGSVAHLNGHVEYVLHVRADSMEWSVHHRFNSFSKLNDLLLQREKHAPCRLAAPFPRKKMFGSTSHAVVLERIKGLQRWIDRILTVPWAGTSNEFLEFVGALNARQKEVILLYISSKDTPDNAAADPGSDGAERQRMRRPSAVQLKHGVTELKYD